MSPSAKLEKEALMFKKFCLLIMICSLSLVALPGRAQTSCPPPVNWVAYTVVRGDTLFAIARRSGSTVSALVAANCLSNPNLIHAGLRLFIPTASTSDNAVQIVRFWADKSSAKPGDSLTLRWEIQGKPNA